MTGFTQTATKSKNKNQKIHGKNFCVILLNDDYTTMDFVVLVLEKFFEKNRDSAIDLMLHIHNKGYGVCGVYSKEIAETKSVQVIRFAEANKQPLRCKIKQIS